VKHRADGRLDLAVAPDGTERQLATAADSRTAQRIATALDKEATVKHHTRVTLALALLTLAACRPDPNPPGPLPGHTAQADIPATVQLVKP
jgi:hypothetical protein